MPVLPRVSAFSCSYGLGDAVAAHDRLHRLGEHLPVGVEIGGDARLIDLELVAGPARSDSPAEQRVPERHAHVAQHRRIGEVALPARDWQLLRHVAQERVGEPEIALGILEVDRVDLVRHRRRADLALLRLLPEVAERDVAPEVAVEVEQDRVGARDRVEQLGDAVVRLDLRRVRIELEAEPVDDLRRQALPVDVRVRDDVGVVVADRAVHLALDRHVADRRDLPREAREDVRHLLAERRRRRRLAVRAREHRRRRRARARARAARRDVRRAPAAGSSRRASTQHQPVGEVVDVLGRAREMDEFADARDLGHVGEALLQPVLDRLDVVVGRALDRLHALAVGWLERRGRARRAPRAPPRKTARPRRSPARRRARSSHAISIRTRARIRPNSLKCSRSASTLAA